MFKKIAKVAALLLLSVWPLQHANAVIGTMDTVPAATLLYPYFEVDLNSPTGKNTLIGLTNTSASAGLTRVTLWSNTGVPVYGFNIYLTGYDAISFSMRDVINGTLPVTASAGQDPANLFSPKGPISQDINYASCGGQMPYTAPVNASFVADLKSMLTGGSSTQAFPGQCVATNLGDNVARGYLTIDDVNQCSLNNPNTPGYFGSGGSGIATNRNVYLGDYTLIDPSQNIMNIENAVSIEASSTAPETSVAGAYTFYGRLTNWTAADNREPLATNWVLQGETNTSSAIVWRDPKVVPAAFSCATGRPSYAPLGQENITFFDPAAEPTLIPTTPTVINPFPLPAPTFGPVATQIAAMNNATMQLPTSIKMGWVFMNLNTTVAPAGANPPVDPAASQSHVTVLRNHKNLSRLSTGAIATPLDSATAARHNTFQ